MRRALDLRLRPRISWLTLSLVILATPAVARADLLVSELGEKPAAASVVPQDPSHLSAASAYCRSAPPPDIPPSNSNRARC